MPELPEVEAVCRRLRPQVVGRRIVEASVFRCGAPGIGEAVADRVIQAVDRAGKHILMRLSGGVTLETHLRMSGNLYAIPNHLFLPQLTRIALRLDNDAAVILEDRRALARMEAVSTIAVDERLARELGPEPYSPTFTPDWLASAAKRSRQSSKVFLMDQRRVAGLGNIYAAEALFRAGINPRKAVHKLTKPNLRALHAAIVAVLDDAVQSAVSAYAGPGEFVEAESFPVRVYDREGEPCAVCRTPIRRIPQNGRSTYYCPVCQR